MQTEDEILDIPGGGWNFVFFPTIRKRFLHTLKTGTKISKRLQTDAAQRAGFM